MTDASAPQPCCPQHCIRLSLRTIAQPALEPDVSLTLFPLADDAVPAGEDAAEDSAPVAEAKATAAEDAGESDAPAQEDTPPDDDAAGDARDDSPEAAAAAGVRSHCIKP